MELKLPPSVISQVEINRILRELDALDNFFLNANTRKAGSPLTPPRITYQLQQLARENKLNLLEENTRGELASLLNNILKVAPRLHVSFAAEPSPRATDAVLGWLRSNIHPQTLLTIGLQPTIAAGCVLRTPNKVFDMSLRSYLKGQEGYMVKLIQGAISGRR